ncbi:MAG: hypothetical protein KJN67_03900 [Pontiella sp.]|nr:hypothetical protein [Pontiella sp.]MBT8046292.1 hypothetical protein [Pontiella sp.]NNJ69716.1 hypothetical protein [Kiritimatiellales bacterium]
MIKIDWVRIGFLATASVVAFSVGKASAEEVTVTINDVKVEDTVYTPYYEIQTEQDHQQGSAQKWIRLGVYFTTEGGWIDEIDITQLAVIKGDKAEKDITLSEKVHYINIEPGDHYVYVYLHPSYVKRYEIDAFDLDSAAFIAVDGKVVATKETSKDSPKGWSLDRSNQRKGYLLNHAETPFWFVNYDFKEIIKTEK